MRISIAYPIYPSPIEKVFFYKPKIILKNISIK